MTLRPRSRRHGSACIEFAVVLLFVVPLLLGVWEVGRLVEVEQHLNNAVREGARQASTANVNTAGVQQVVVNYLNDPTTANQLDQIEVSVSIPFNNVRWVLLNQITPVQNLTASTEFYSMRDVPLSINTTIPLQ